jgi:aspartyl/glutamyl-tRNA(Asn/Gln) amidotransferase C subunit
VSVTPDDISRIASLAHLRLSNAESERLTSELNRILEHVDELGTLEFVEDSDIAPQVRKPLPSTRPEGAEVPDPLSGPVAGFGPDVRDGFFVVPPPPGLEQGGDE